MTIFDEIRAYERDVYEKPIYATASTNLRDLKIMYNTIYNVSEGQIYAM